MRRCRSAFLIARAVVVLPCAWRVSGRRASTQRDVSRRRVLLNTKKKRFICEVKLFAAGICIAVGAGCCMSAAQENQLLFNRGWFAACCSCVATPSGTAVGA